jgi:hypothetical protein
MARNDALSNLQRHFPQVTTIKMAEKNLEIEVISADEKASKRKDHEKCAMAVACKRAYKADGVVVARRVAYLIKGTLAVKFIVPESVAREIVSFDRGGEFSPGIYHLHAPPKSDTKKYRDEINKKRKDKHGHTGTGPKNFPHKTLGIRAILGGIDDKG